MRQFNVVGIGEVLWDLLPGGRKLGGAPCNFAYHAAALGARATIVSRIGADDSGRDLMDELHSLAIDTHCIEIDPTAPTSTVSVSFTADRQAIYTIHEDVAWDFLTGEPAGVSAAATADAICFGSLAQRSPAARATIYRLLQAAPSERLRIFDVNLRQHFYSRDVIEASLNLANFLKINDDELKIIAPMFALSGSEQSQLQQLVDRFDLHGVALTRGAHGSLLSWQGDWSDRAGVPTKVVDTVGAGDSFTAAMTMGLLRNWPLAVTHERAARLAAFVCSRAGATPRLPAELIKEFTSNP